MTDLTRSSVTILVMRIFFLTLAYVIAGRLSLLLAIPPGFVTGLFLPLGIALGAVLIWGMPMLWGVFLGSTLLNISVSLSGGQPWSLHTFVVAAEIAAGSVIASAAGTLLIRHYIGFPDKLTDEKKIFAFFVLGGPVATSLSASCGAMVLYFNEIIHFKQLLFTWWTWWIGDAIGVLIAAPIMCVLFASPRHFWRTRMTTVALPMVISSVVVVLVFVLASNNEQKKLENHFEQQAELISNSVNSSFAAVAYSLATLRGLFIASEEVTREEFSAYVKHVIPGIKGVSGFSWNQYLPHSQRFAYEKMMQAQGFENFYIKEKNSSDEFVTAPFRDDYTVIGFIEPWPENIGLMGINVGADPVRAAAQLQARDTAQLTMTPPLHLYRDIKYTPGVIVYHPVYKNMDTLTTAQDRQKSLIGFATAIVRISELIPPVLAAFNTENFELEIIDNTDGASPRLFYSSEPESMSVYARSLEIKRELSFGGRYLSLSIAPSEAFLLNNRSLQSWFVLAGGLLFCSFLGGFLLLVTGRAQYVRDLVEQRTKELAAILEQAVEAILVVDEQGHILRANPAANHLFGHNFTLASNMPLGNVVPSLRDFFVHEGKSLETISWRETSGIHSDGREMPIDLSLSPVALKEQKFFTVIVHDATTKRNVDRLKNEFISTVSHELRTPLTSIKGALGIVLSGDLGALEGKNRDLLVIANNNADRLTRLVNDILDIDKLEFGNIQLNIQHMQIYPLLHQSVAQNQGYGARYGVEVVLDPVDVHTSHLHANVDADRFLQVMSNLLSNAVKYSHLGSRVRVNLKRIDNDIRVSVIDEGQGIPENFRQRIFRKFAQADSSDTRKRDGTGLGLSITKVIVERLGGKIDYHSIEGHGTTFFFTLPIAE